MISAICFLGNLLRQYNNENVIYIMCENTSRYTPNLQDIILNFNIILESFLEYNIFLSMLYLE